MPDLFSYASSPELAWENYQAARTHPTG